ncbi:MAG: glycosyltransferase [Chloroflexi bacterium]|nr:glycosyltransferase [Chloroflexota bacterium]
MTGTAVNDLQQIYRNRFGEHRNARAEIWRVLVRDFFQASIKRSDTVLDLGCGYGEFLNHVRCARRIGVDLNPDSASMLDADIEFHHGVVDDLSFLSDHTVDVVFTSNLLEHLPDRATVERTIIEARRVLKPGGHFIALGPNIRFVAGDYWSFWDHRIPISDQSLCELLEVSRFEVVDVRERFLPFTARSALPKTPALVRLYLRVPLAWRILGKQFLIKARKPAVGGEGTADDLVSVVLPVYNERENIQPCVRGLSSALQGIPHELLVCYDYDEDSTLAALDAMPDRPPTIRLIRNKLGKGVANAMVAGFAAARGDVIVTSMADLSDPPSVIQAMVEKVREHGADVVSGSRYMRGGSQIGGPRIKRMMSRATGLSLHYATGLPTHDATTNFRAYSRRFVQAVPIESDRGFEVALELTTKAHRLGYRVDEVPSSWKDRSAGESNFDLAGWLPAYLRWYGAAMATPMLRWCGGVIAIVAACFTVRRLLDGILKAPTSEFAHASADE